MNAMTESLAMKATSFLNLLRFFLIGSLRSMNCALKFLEPSMAPMKNDWNCWKFFADLAHLPFKLFIFMIIAFSGFSSRSSSHFWFETFEPLQTTAALAEGGSHPVSPGCAEEFKLENEKCIQAMKRLDALAAAQLQASGWREASNPQNIQSASALQTDATATGQAANQSVNTTCAAAQVSCEAACQQAMTEHRTKKGELLNLASQQVNQPPARQASLKSSEQQAAYAKTAEANLESCKTSIGKVVAGTGIQAWQLGLAAAAAGGVMLLTKSKKDGGGNQANSAALEGTDASLTTSDGTGIVPEEFSSLEERKQYWIANQCEQLLAVGTSQASITNVNSTETTTFILKASSDSQKISTCAAIAGNAEFSGTLLALGGCSDVSGLNRPDCFDRLNSYCLQAQPQYRLKDHICSGFCGQNSQADACQIQPEIATKPLIIDNNNNQSSTSPSSNPSPSPFTSTTASVTQKQGNSKSLSSAPSNSAKSFSASSQRQVASTQLDCAQPLLVNSPACEAPMNKYCSQYGSQGKGCPQYCKSHPGICKK